MYILQMIITYRVRAYMRVTVIDFSEVDKFPLTIDVSDKAYTRKIFGKIDMVYSNLIFISTALPVAINKNNG